MSDMFQGTLTHMAPEVLMEGKISKAADVYAFGMTLWELYTGCSPFSQVPRALLGHIVTKVWIFVSTWLARLETCLPVLTLESLSITC